MYNSIHETLIVGKKVIYLPSCHSTNDIAAELVHNGLGEEGTVVITDEQTKGRGQRGTGWVSPVGENLTFSFIISPKFISISDQFLISQTFALAVNAFLLSKKLDSKIKWPNDVMIGTRKVCGMLVENSIQGSGISSSVVGIGLNINKVSGGIRATSVGEILGQKLSLQDEFKGLVSFLDAYYLRLRAGNYEAIRSEYLSNLLGINQKRTYRFSFGTASATIVGIGPHGKLLVSVEGETNILELDIKELEWIWQD